MSATEDCELQDLVKQTLEKTGSLSKIRAELRAGIFLALEENGCFQGTNSKNHELEKFSQNANGALLLCLMQEFFECYGLSFTMSVLEPELASYNVHCSWKSRTELINQLNLPSHLKDKKERPLMYHILTQFLSLQNVPSRISHISENQKEITRLPNNWSSERSALPITNVTPEEIDLTDSTFDDEIEHLETAPVRISSKTNNVERKGNARSTAVSGKDLFVTDLNKPNLSLLGDLPPLSSSTNTGKTSLSPSGKSSKQISKLKAMLIDTSYENTNASNITDDELINSLDHDDISDSDNLDENQIQELLKD